MESKNRYILEILGHIWVFFSLVLFVAYTFDLVPNALFGLFGSANRQLYMVYFTILTTNFFALMIINFSDVYRLFKSSSESKLTRSKLIQDKSPPNQQLLGIFIVSGFIAVVYLVIYYICLFYFMNQPAMSLASSLVGDEIVYSYASLFSMLIFIGFIFAALLQGDVFKEKGKERRFKFHFLLACSFLFLVYIANLCIFQLIFPGLFVPFLYVTDTFFYSPPIALLGPIIFLNVIIILIDILFKVYYPGFLDKLGIEINETESSFSISAIHSCPNCHYLLKEGNKKCHKCGYELK